jgi:hypothetical protein
MDHEHGAALPAMAASAAAALGQRQRDCAADVAPRPGHERHAPGQFRFSHRSSPQRL